MAVSQDGLTLRHVKNQTKEICKLAIQQNKSTSQYAKYSENSDDTFYVNYPL